MSSELWDIDILTFQDFGCSVVFGWFLVDFREYFTRKLQVQGASMWAKLGGVHVTGWLLSILSTAAVAKAAKVGERASSLRLSADVRCFSLHSLSMFQLFPKIFMYRYSRIMNLLVSLILFVPYTLI